jgi:hypothetical protein
MTERTLYNNIAVLIKSCVEEIEGELRIYYESQGISKADAEIKAEAKEHIRRW